MGRSVSGYWQGVSSTAVLYGSLALFTSILHNVFLLYYVETFVSIYKIDKISFWLGEVSVGTPAQPQVARKWLKRSVLGKDITMVTK